MSGRYHFFNVKLNVNRTEYINVCLLPHLNLKVNDIEYKIINKFISLTFKVPEFEFVHQSFDSNQLYLVHLCHIDYTKVLKELCLFQLLLQCQLSHLKLPFQDS